MHRTHGSFSIRKAGVAVAGAALVLSASACGNMPTAPNNQLGMEVSPADATSPIDRTGLQRCANSDGPRKCNNGPGLTP
jgi:hypothetical protein